MIEFIRLSARNFRSWKELDVDLHDQGVVCIKGQTGFGKSSIFLALHWGLYGKLPDDVRADEVRGSKEPTAVRIILRREGHEYVIRRYRGHPTYKNKVFFSGMGIPRTVEDSYVKSVQGLITSFLGVSETLFLTTTYFAQRNFHHFHTLTDTAKKTYLESLTYGSLFEACEAITRERVRSQEREIAHLEGQLEGLEESIKNIQVQSEERKQELKEEVFTFRTKIDAIEIHLCKLEQQKKQLEHFAEEKEENNNAVWAVENTIQDRNEDIERYEMQDSVCPRCGLVMLESLKQERMAGCYDEIKKLTKKLDALKDKRIPILTGYKKYATTLEWMDEKYREIDRYVSEISLRKAAYGRVDNSQELRKRVLVLERKISELRKQLAYTSFWTKGFSLNGLRTFVLVNAIKFLSERIKHYLHRIVGERIDFCLTLENMRLLTDCNGRSYGSLSGGERQAVDLSTGLALRDLAEHYSKSQFNLLILDEGFEGMDKHLTAVAQSLLLEYAKPTTFLVTHQDLEGNFAQVFEVKKIHEHSQLLKVY